MSPVVALVGRPNVGKSALFNTLTRSKAALVADFSGLTRDRQYGKVKGSSVVLIDTGGINKKLSDLSLAIKNQTNLAIDESDILFFIVDVKDGLLPLDEEIADTLRKANKPIYLIINKVDGLTQDNLIVDFDTLGFENSFSVSSAHNRGISNLSKILKGFEKNKSFEETQFSNSNHTRISIIGRPNVGKSTLINNLLGEDRVIVSEEAGTTRDSIEVPFKFNNKEMVLIDTAGLRRKRSIKEEVERFSTTQSLESIHRSHVVILLVDSKESMVDQDLHLLGLSLALSRPVIIGANKIDLLSKREQQDLKSEIARRIKFADFIKIQFLSAIRGTGVKKLIKLAEKAYISTQQDIETPVLNKILKEALHQHPPPLIGRFRPKLRYVHSISKNPPSILIHGNNLKTLSNSYKKYLENFFRSKIGLESSTLEIKFREGENPYEKKPNVLTDRQRKKRKRLIKKRSKK